MGRIGRYLQGLSITDACPTFQATVHQIGHTIGFFHEQSRRDRDKYVNVYLQNVLPGYESQFHRAYNTDSLGVTYDFNSIMQYSANAFAKSGTVTISAKEKDLPFGNALELSPLDIKQTNLLYGHQCS